MKEDLGFKNDRMKKDCSLAIKHIGHAVLASPATNSGLNKYEAMIHQIAADQ